MLGYIQRDPSQGCKGAADRPLALADCIPAKFRMLMERDKCIILKTADVPQDNC